MVDMFQSLMPLIVGLGLGLFFYLGLLWTVKKLATTKHPALLFMVSFIVRSVSCLGGLYLVMDNQLDRLFLFFIGFLIVRFVSFSYLNTIKVVASRSNGEVLQ